LSSFEDKNKDLTQGMENIAIDDREDNAPPKIPKYMEQLVHVSSFYASFSFLNTQ